MEVLSVIGGVILLAIMVIAFILIALLVICDSCPDQEYCNKHANDKDFTPPCGRSKHLF